MSEQLVMGLEVDRATKRCRKCGERKAVDEFDLSGGYRRSYCRPCAREYCRNYGLSNRPKRNARLREWRRRNPDAARLKDRRQRFMRKYGLTLDEVETLLSRHDGLCWICLSLPARCIDHDHQTRAVRGALCNSCNTFLGRVESGPQIIPRMLEYLDAANGDQS